MKRNLPRDITKREITAQKLQQSEEQIQAVGGERSWLRNLHVEYEWLGCDLELRRATHQRLSTGKNPGKTFLLLLPAVGHQGW
jgi:hypothetical protein